jgi:inosose dehydratase
MAALEDPTAWPELERQVVGAGELINSLGGKFLVLIDDTYTDLFTGRSLAPATLNESAWKRLIETTNRMATVVHDRFGLQLVFHHHAETHVEYENQIEAFLAQTDPARVALCFDIGHFAYRGGDPVAFMRKHYQRIPYLHLKSVDPVLRDRVNTEKIPFAIAVGMDLFCEPAQGAVDFPAFRDLLREIDYTGWGIVEQDMYPAPFDKPFPIAKRTRGYLREIGIG